MNGSPERKMVPVYPFPSTDWKPKGSSPVTLVVGEILTSVECGGARRCRGMVMADAAPMPRRSERAVESMLWTRAGEEGGEQGEESVCQVSYKGRAAKEKPQGKGLIGLAQPETGPVSPVGCR